METKITSPVVKGLVISLLLIILNLVLYFTNQQSNRSLGFIQHIILIGGVIWGCIVYAKQMNSNVSFGNVFSHGFKTTAMAIGIFAVYNLIALKFIFPEMVDIGLEEARKVMENEGKLSDEDIEKGLAFTKKYFIPFIIGGIIIMFGIIGAIASLIGAAVAKKNPQGPFINQG